MIMVKKIISCTIALLTCFSLVFSVSAEKRDRIDQSSPPPKKAESEIKTETVVKEKNKIQKLKDVNPDTIGWLYVPGTTINEVVVFDPTNRNTRYGNMDFYGRDSKNGTTYADYRCTFGSGSRNELSRNTVIYGHSWTDNPNSILFAQLKKYKDEEFAKTHPYIYFSTEKETIAFEVCAVFSAHVNFPYILSEPKSGYSVMTLLDAIDRSSIYDYDIEVKPEDKVLTLSTCTFSAPGHPRLATENDYRFVIMAKMVPTSETLKQTAKFTVKEKVASPDNYSFVP